MYFSYKRYKNFFTADFETSTSQWNVEKARVWLWDICTRDYEHINGTDIESFLNYIRRYDGYLFSFHNLSYDGCYILDYLLRHGYKHSTNKTLHVKEFFTLITPQGTHYAYQICFSNGNTVTINDSFRHNSMSVDQLAKTYKLPILKEEIDYDTVREIGHEPTEQELKYINHDTEIMMRILNEDLHQGFDKFTESGNSRKFFKSTLKNYDDLLPVLNDFEDEFIRKSYRGGYVYLKEEHFNKELHSMMSLDINSMYPAQMLHRPMPIGLPLYGHGRKEDDKLASPHLCWVQHFKCCFHIKPNRPPTIARKSFKGFSVKDLYLKSSGFKRCELWLTNVDLKLFFECYEVWDIEYIDFMSFESMCGYEVTPEEAEHMTVDEIIKLDGQGSLYYDYLYPYRMEKEHSTGGQRARAKKQQNIAYGAQSTAKTGDLCYPELYKDHLRFVRYEGEKRKGGYIPIGTFITAYSRELLITNIIRNWDRFVYCDTDSLYLLGQERPDMPIHRTLYGFFKLEHYISRAKFLGCKRYIYLGREPDEEQDRLKVTCCGAPPSVTCQMNFDNFKPYNKEKGEGVFNGKLSSHIVCGGKHLQVTTYKLVC